MISKGLPFLIHRIEQPTVISRRHDHFTIGEHLGGLRTSFPPHNMIFDLIEFCKMPGPDPPGYPKIL